jgi:hypothetical protein
MSVRTYVSTGPIDRSYATLCTSWGLQAPSCIVLRAALSDSCCIAIVLQYHGAPAMLLHVPDTYGEKQQLTDWDYFILPRVCLCGVAWGGDFGDVCQI